MKKHVVDFPPPMDRLDVMASLFRAMADPTRLLLLIALHAEERTVGALVELCDRPQSTVSRQLSSLRQAGLVTARREAQHVHYRITNVHVADLLEEAYGHAEHLAGDIAHDHGDES